MNCELLLTYDTPALRQTGSRNLTGSKTLPTIWGTYMKLVTKYQISAINSYWEKCAYMFNVYKNQLSRQTGSRNLTGPKTLPTIWHTYMKLVTKYQIPVINSCLEKCDEKSAYTNVCSMCIKINKVAKQEVGIWWVQKCFPRHGVPIWSLWPNIRFLPSIVAEKNVTKNLHICSMCIKINEVGKQEVGIWRVQKCYPQYGIPIWCLWPNIRFLPSTVTEKNVTKNILDGWKEGQR
jgi:ribosomal protein L37AE/L43A